MILCSEVFSINFRVFQQKQDAIAETERKWKLNVTGSNFQSWSTSKYLTVGTTLHIIDMTKLHSQSYVIFRR